MTTTLKYSSNQPNIVQNVKDLVSNVVDKFVVRPLGSPNQTGISGYVFDVIDDEEVSVDSDITDHYVEANYAIQDHIALRPIRFTLRGFVGELVDDFPNALATIYTQAKGLLSLGGLLPTFNTQDAEFYAKLNNIVQLGTNVVNQANNIFSLFNSSSTTATRQQKAFQYFLGMWQTRQLCKVETPFAIFENMAIENIRALQSGATRIMSDFTITFKQIQTVSSVISFNTVNSLMTSNTGTISLTPLIAGGRFQQIIANGANLGTDNCTDSDTLGNLITVGNVSLSTFKPQVQSPN